MTLEKPNKAQLALLSSIEFPNSEWAKDIIWLKRMDAVANPDMQKRANELYITTIKKHNLFSKEKRKYKLISALDNVWESQRLIEKNER